MDHLLRLQLAYDVAKTRTHAQDISMKRYVPA
jgi:antitoxin HigA-1